MLRSGFVGLAVVVLEVVRCAAAGSFLDPSRLPDPLQLPALLDEFESALGPEHREASESRLEDITAALSSTFASLPKNVHGGVTAPSARYAIHRYFMQRHGWQIQGLAPRGESWMSSPALALGDRVPDDFRDLFTERVGTRGLDLHELAVLAATLENMIHRDAVGRLEATYRFLGKGPDENLGEEEATWVLDTYMQAYLLGHSVSSLSHTQVKNLKTEIRGLPFWPELQQSMREVKQEVAPGLARFTLSNITRITEAVSDRFGRFHDGEGCEDMRSRLVKLEEANGTGRVKLVDFYESMDDQFREHPEFLKAMGVLDDSDPSTRRVIIPNYLYAASNCLDPASAFYSICCIDRCEVLMGHLESELGKPFANPGDIARLVSALPSASVQAPRTLPPALLQKLEDVAEHHSGVVPLHSRLFAQWMHFAYPRECLYPHLSGTTTQVGLEEWERTTGMSSVLTTGQRDRYVESLWVAAEKSPSSLAMASDLEDEPADLCSAMWTMEEEFIDEFAWKGYRAELQLKEETRSFMQGVLRAAVIMTLVASMLLILREQVWQAFAGLKAVRSDGQPSSKGADV